MKNNIKLISIIFIIAVILILTSNLVKAGAISTVDVKTDEKSITVSGTVESDVSAVSISVFDKDGEKIITMKTTSVDDDNKYSKNIELPGGTYIVKVADYSGGEYVVKENIVVEAKKEEENKTTGTESNVEENKTEEIKKEEDKVDNTAEESAKEDNENTVTTATVEEKSNNPKTGDNISGAFVGFIVAILFVIIGVFILYKDFKKRKNKK